MCYSLNVELGLFRTHNKNIFPGPFWGTDFLGPRGERWRSSVISGSEWAGRLQRNPKLETEGGISWGRSIWRGLGGVQKKAASEKGPRLSSHFVVNSVNSRGRAGKKPHFVSWNYFVFYITSQNTPEKKNPRNPKGSLVCMQVRIVH